MWEKLVKVAQLYPILCNPTDYTVHGILQARILEWVAFPFSRVSSQPRDQTQVSHDSWTIIRLNAEEWILLNCGIGEDSWESLGLQGDQTSQSQRKSVLNIQWKDWCWSSNTLAPDAKSWLIRKNPDAGKDWRQEEKGTAEDEMVGWHHWLSGYEFKQTPRDGEGQGCCSPWGLKESTKQQNQWTCRYICTALT